MRRRFALFAIGMVGIIQMADGGTTTAAALIREAENLAYFEGFGPAQALLEQAVRKASKLGDARTTAIALDRLGSVLDFTGDVTAGAARHREALVLAEGIHDRVTAASIEASIGLADWRQSKYDAAFAALHEALAIQAASGDVAGAGRTLVFIGRVHFKKGEYDAARGSYRRAHHLLNAAGDLRWVSIVLEDLGDLALERGFFVEGLERFQEALAARAATRDVAGEIYMLTAIGRVYLQQGAFRESLSWLDNAVRLSETVDAKPSRALALYHRGIAFESLGDHAQALELFAEALAIKEQLGDRRQQAWILGHIGDAHAALRHQQAALDAYRRSLRISEDIGDPRGVASGLSNSASMSLELGDFEGALAAFRRSSELFSDNQPAFAATAVSGMARAYAAAGQGTAALDQGRRAVEMARGGNDHVRWSSLRALGSIERRFGHRDLALGHLRESLAVIESMRERVVPSADVRAGFLEGKQGVYAETVELLVELGRADEALEIAERARTRAFLDMLSARDKTTPNLTVGAQALTLEEMRGEIRRRDTTVVEFFSTADRLFTWVMQPDGRIQAASAKISRIELMRLVGTLRESLATSQDVRAQLHQLHLMLIAPVAHLLPSDPDRLVTIVPHGPLFLLSFAALANADGAYLVERHALSYSPSISVLRHTGRNRDRSMTATGHRLLAIGNPRMPERPRDQPRLGSLPGAEQEAIAIGRLYPPQQVTTLTGSTAREGTVRELAPAHAIIHFATHAVIFDDEPMASYLALTPDAGDDGFLTVAEIFGLDLTADLVALSACDTGLGRISGEGVVGLSGAFMYAGAASVLVSLWPVADVVARNEMEIFYRALTQAPAGKAAALAAAQRNVIRQLRDGRVTSPKGRVLQEHPVLWAPFVLVGEAR